MLLNKLNSHKNTLFVRYNLKKCKIKNKRIQSKSCNKKLSNMNENFMKLKNELIFIFSQVSLKQKNLNLLALKTK